MQFKNTTPFGWRCRKAALLLIALGLAALCALFTPADGQNMQAMVKHQPFPYPVGVAMDTLQYKAIKAKLEAANTLRTSASEHIAVLEAEISGLKAALTYQTKLCDYDAHKADSLVVLAADRKQKLDAAEQDLDQAQRAIDEVLQTLPRRIRKSLKTASPDQIATAVTDYIHQLQHRKWYWAGGATILTTFFTLSAIIF